MARRAKNSTRTSGELELRDLSARPDGPRGDLDAAAPRARDLLEYGRGAWRHQRQMATWGAPARDSRRNPAVAHTTGGVCATTGNWVPRSPAAVLLTSYVAFALLATWLRRYYRHATQSMRLVLGFTALLAPFVAVYPMRRCVGRTHDSRGHRTGLRAADGRPVRGHPPRAARHSRIRSIECRSCRPSTVERGPAGRQPDGLPRLDQTSLSRTRVMSDIELYGPDRALVSRFALNLPEYLYRASTRDMGGHGLSWEVSGEVTRFGATTGDAARATRHLRRERRGGGRRRAARRADDYQALPFVSSPNPYGDVLGMAPLAATPTLPGLQVVVYGWSLRPLFTSSGIAWSLDPSLFARLYRTARRSGRRAKPRAGGITCTSPEPRRRLRAGLSRDRPRSTTPTRLAEIVGRDRRALRAAFSSAPWCTRRSRAGRSAAARAVPRNPHELLPQAVPVLRARGRSARCCCSRSRSART